MNFNNFKSAIICFAIFLFCSVKGTAQFQRIYGNSQNNYFHKVIPDGANNYYALGSEDNYGIVSHVLNNGQLDWTIRFIAPCGLTDAAPVFAGFGVPFNLMIVGFTLPFDNTNKSLLAIVSATGGLIYTQEYDTPGNEAFVRIAQNPGGTFAVTGVINTPSTSTDVLLMNVSPNGTINNTNIYGNIGDNGFFYDNEILGFDQFVAGYDGNAGVIFRVDGNPIPNFVAGVRDPSALRFDDLALDGNEVLAVGTPTAPGGLPLLRRFDANLLSIWTVEVSNLNAVHQVEVSPTNGDIYVVGTKNINGIDRTVVVRIDDSSGTPIPVWAKYLDNGETGHSIGYITMLQSGDIAFADAKSGISGGFGQDDAFMTVTNDNMNSYCTKNYSVSLIPDNPFLEGPELDFMDFTNLNPVSPLDFNTISWQQTGVCIDPTPILDCSEVRVQVEPEYGEREVWFNGDEAETSYLSLTYSPASGSIFPVGTTPVVIAATSASGDTSSCTFNVVVEKMPYDSIQPPTGMTPDGLFDRVRDRFGNPYRLSDLQIPETMSGSLLCGSTAGYFNLYFEPGCGMDGSSQTEIDRRAVICQLFSDLSQFINRPSGAADNVNIWIRNIGNVQGASANHLGVCTPFYVLPATVSSTGPFKGGIVEGEVWKTINSGVDSYTGLTSPLSTVGGPGGGFYHAMIAFNFTNHQWHTDLTTSPAFSLYDLYSVGLHEATHALGFASLINQVGNSVFANTQFAHFFSRYDTWLRSSTNLTGVIANQPLITNTGACTQYDYQFNPQLPLSVIDPVGASNSDETDCPKGARFVDASTLNLIDQIVYTPNVFALGSSLSHFEDGCPNLTWSPTLNNKVYVMSNANGNGSAYMKRFLKPTERRALCAMGYQVQNQYGNPSQQTFKDYSPDTNCPGLGVAGVNDGINAGGAYAYMTTPSVPTTPIFPLTNDVGAVSFECLQVIYGGGSAVPSAGTSFTYGAPTPGVKLLRYTPVSASGKRGNITYIFVYVKSPGCTPNACNMVSNGGFEQGTNCGLLDPVGSAMIDCWKALSYSPDLFTRTCNFSSLTLGGNTYGSIPATDSHNGSPNDKIIGLYKSLVGQQQVCSEAVQTQLTIPLIPGQQYVISFWAKTHNNINGASASNIPAIVRVASTANYPLAHTICYPTTGALVPLFTDLTVPNDNTWHQLTQTFTFNASGQHNNLIIAYAPVSFPQGVTQAYFFLDDVSLEPLSSAVSFTPPSPLCLNSPLIDLTLNNIVSIPGGTFTGSPCISGGIFDPACAGVGSHVITYTVIDANGCPSSATATIQVVVGPAVTFSLPPVPCCLNDAPILLDVLASPPGGVFSGPGVIYSAGSYYFFPGNAGTGTVTLTYTYTGGACPVLVSASKQVVTCVDICEISNNCLDFDGVNDYVNAPNPLNTNVLQNNFTIACWFRDDRSPNAPPDGLLRRLFGFAWSGPRFEVGDQDGLLTLYSVQTGIVQSIGIRDGAWHHLAAVKNGANATIYLDGVQLAGMTNMNVGAFAGTAQDFHIGDWAGGGTIPRFWQGRVDEFKVWGAALTAAQLRDEMTCSLDPNNINLLVHFPFDQFTAFANNVGNTLANNVVTGGLDGTLINFGLNAGVSSNWVARGRDRLPNCNPDHFAWLEGNPGRNISGRSKVYDSYIFSAGLESAYSATGQPYYKPTFTKREPDGSINGTSSWRRVLEIEGVINDFVRTDEGCYLLVGVMPKFQGNNFSFIARIDQNGTLAWLHVHDFAERESLTRIIRSDNPDDPLFPYVICGIRKNGNTSNDDILLLTLDNQGTINWLRQIGNGLPLPTDDNFCFDLSNFQGGYALVGDYNGNVLPLQRPVFFVTDNTGLQLAPSSQYQNGAVFYDVEPAPNGSSVFLAGQATPGDAFVAKLDMNGTPIWAKSFPNIKVLRRLVVRPNGDIFALGQRDNTNIGIYRNVIVKLRDLGNNATTVWQKYGELTPTSNWLDNEFNWTPADLAWYSGNMYFFTDSRVNHSNNFGNEDIGAVLYNLDQNPDICPFTLEAVPSQNFTLVQAQMPLLTNILVTPVAPAVINPINPLVLQRDSLCTSYSCSCNFTNMSFSKPGLPGTSWYRPVSSCGLPPIVLPGCPGQTTNIRFTGRLRCRGGCAFNGLNWTLTGPNSTNPIASGTSSQPGFSIPITLAMVQVQGTYTITINGQCGTTSCQQCVVQFTVPACPPPCTCTQPGFNNAVNDGFSWLQLPGCNFKFTPKSLTSCDVVTWKVAPSGSSVFTTFATGTGNQTVSYTFPSSNQYVVCMTVKRTPPGAAFCEVSRCWTLDVDCSLLAQPDGGPSKSLLEVNPCLASIVENGGFTMGATEGGMTDIGAVWNWNYSGGNPEVLLEMGKADSNLVRMRGNSGYYDLLYQDSLPLGEWDSIGLSMAIRPLVGLLMPGTELVVRLSKHRQDSLWCDNDSTCIEVMRLPLPELDSSIWLTAGSFTTVKSVALPFLTIHVENPFYDDDVALKSVVDIDNVCLANYDIVSTKHTFSSTPEIQLFPNPTFGSFTMRISGGTLLTGKVQILDLLGRTLHTETLLPGRREHDFSIEALPAGVYFVKVLDGSELVWVQKIVKQ